MKNNKKNLNWKFFIYSRKYFSLAIAMIIASITIAMFATYPQVDIALSNFQQLKKEELNLDKTQKKAIELEQIRLLPEFSKAGLVDEVLPSHKPLLEIINSLNNVAENTNVTINNFSIKPGNIATDSTKISTTKSSSAKKYQQLDFSLSASGDMSNVEDFISLLERISPITTVTDIALSRSKKDDGNGGEIVSAKAELNLSSYYFTQSIKTAIGQPLPKIGQKEQDIFTTIQEFTPANFNKQTEIEGGNLEDIFNINSIDIQNLEEEIKKEEIKESLGDI